MRVRCKSGLMGSRSRLHSRYKDFAEFERYAEAYNLHVRLGYKTTKGCWRSNPMVEDSVNPADFRRVKVTEYEDLPLLCSLIARAVCHDPPCSEHPHNAQLRKKFIRSKKRVSDFAARVDAKCKLAYENRTEWFMRVVRMRGDKGRDHLYYLFYSWLVKELFEGHWAGPKD